MAERRMFAKTIIDSDAFLDMPPTTQNLYFHLSMRADDEGFINKPKGIIRLVGASQGDIEMLIAKKFIIPFESGVVVIKHWKIHNYIRKDCFTETKYKDEKAVLSLDENKSYTLCDESVTIPLRDCDESVDTGKERKGKVRKGKVSNTYTPAVQEVVNYLNELTASHYKSSTDKTRKLIEARLKEGFTVEDFKTVIYKKTKEWKGSDMEKFLRPETLFGTKFEGYLNQKEVQPQGNTFLTNWEDI